MKQEWITGRAIKEALIVLLKNKYGTGYKYYSRQDVEGMLLPAFFVDVRLIQRKDETANICSKEYTCRIIYFQADPSAEDADADQYDKAEEIPNLLVCKDSKKNPKGGMVLAVSGRYLTVTECGIDYVGRENNIMELSFTLKFYDFKEPNAEEAELMKEFGFNEKLEDINHGNA